MGEVFRTRRFVPVPASLRPHRRREAVRVVVTDGTSVLLFSDTDPGLAGSRWWVTPGGGIDPGETPLEAAVRELAEETGLRVAASELRGPVMRRIVVHGYSDQVCEQGEDFYVLRTRRFELDTTGHTEAERMTLSGHAWIPLDALGAQPHPVWPALLAEVVALAERPESWPWELGRVEESTVPV